MVINSKRKGSDFEREAVKLLEEKLDGKWKRIAGSGALGTILEEPLLGGDIVGRLEGFPRTFRLDAKVGYGGAKQLTLQKEWLDKIRKEANATYSIPGLICKFSGARSGTQYFIVLDMDAFTEIVETMHKAKVDLDKLLWKIQSGEK